jgi:cytochrome bd ubiquinol oxidase subunit II
MPELWFCLVALMLTAYVVLDGFDLGVGMLHLFVARTEPERCEVIGSIAPVWNGNEVWLVAGGGALYFAFPGLYAASFSGFYLPLIFVLWLLILRGMSIELREHVDHPIWAPFWDAVFFGSSFLLVVFFGAALGNVVRGVPMETAGGFFLALWTNFTPYGEAGILDWYTIPVALFVVATLAMHGALWLRYKTSGAVHARATLVSRWSFAAVVVFTLVVTGITSVVQPHIMQSFIERPWSVIFPLIALAGLAGVFLFSRRKGGEGRAFGSSCAFVVGMLTSVVSGLFPYVLPSNGDVTKGLTVYNTSNEIPTMQMGIIWCLPGLMLAACYSVLVFRKFSGKVATSGHGARY